jgi:hypothetical protein
MRILRIESEAEIDGNQLVGALADLGINPSSFEWEFSKLEVGDFHMHFERPAGAGAGVAFSIHPGATHHDPCEHEHEHEHEHGGPPHAHGHPGSGHGPHGHDHGNDNGHAREHPAGTADRDVSARPDYDLGALRGLVKNSNLSDRSKEISLALLTHLEGSAPASPGSRIAGAGEVLSESELSLLAQTVLIAVGVDQLGIDQIEIVQAGDAARGGGRSGVDRQTVSLDPVIAAVQAVLPLGDAPAGLRNVRSGVGLPAAAPAGDGPRVQASLLEG